MGIFSPMILILLLLFGSLLKKTKQMKVRHTERCDDWNSYAERYKMFNIYKTLSCMEMYKNLIKWKLCNYY